MNFARRSRSYQAPLSFDLIVPHEVEMAALSKLKDQLSSAAGVSPQALVFGAVTAGVLWKLVKLRASTNQKKKSVHFIISLQVLIRARKNILFSATDIYPLFAECALYLYVCMYGMPELPILSLFSSSTKLVSVNVNVSQ